MIRHPEGDHRGLPESCPASPADVPLEGVTGPIPGGKGGIFTATAGIIVKTHRSERPERGRAPMNILIAGATGLVGQELLPPLLERGHRIIILTRNTVKARERLSVKSPAIRITDYKSGWEGGVDAVINLAGSPVTRSWTGRQRRRILNSRLLSTDYIYIRCLQSRIMPRVWFTVSATGIYHDPAGAPMTEETPCTPSGFLASTCEKIELNSHKVANIVERHCILRLGVILDSRRGYLGKLLPLYRKHLGGRLGSGRQYVPWIHIQDAAGALLFLLEHSECSGIYNITAPHPCQQGELSRELSQRLGRANPLICPGPVLKLLLGRQSELLLQDQNVLPARLLEAGYQFRFENAADALADLLGDAGGNGKDQD